jgi:ATP-dependent helicase/nuclease subunit A
MIEPSAPQPLLGNQMRAVVPEDTVWLSASAGTGKTQVLSSRVLRLLLQPGVEPSQILCLTFTKAGATEMASRINERLAKWVRLGEVALADELKAIGADYGKETIARARTLFASVLDCPGGGLRIDTIHAFAQWLLGAFPLEAGLIPGSRAMEDRERVLLQRQVLSDLLVKAESDALADPQLLEALAELSLQMGPPAVEAWLLRCAEAQVDWIGPASLMRPRINMILGLPSDFDDDQLAEMCEDDFDEDALQCCLAAYRQWSAKTGVKAVACIISWLEADAAERMACFDDLYKVLFTQKDTVRDTRFVEKFEESFEEAGQAVLASMQRIRDARALLGLANRLVKALRLGRAFALAWDEAKKREGLIDFDDQIRLAADLLTNNAYAQWIGYKLDRNIDHILVDEAQDTNAAQWKIILDGLTQEFFSGLGQRGDVLRTLFVVGDYKQAIFRFQGTSPENFEAAKQRVDAAMRNAVANAEATRSNMGARKLQDLDLGQSFRTATPVLEFVDKAIAQIGYEEFGLSKPTDRHQGQDRSGYVALWRPIGAQVGEEIGDGDQDGEPDEEGAESWISKPEREMANHIADQIKAWLDPDGPGYTLVKGKTRRAGPGDIMVLVRKRRELAGLIVARLHAAGVPVAGVDRLRLGAPLAVKDLVAALRFAAQPFDDLTLASLLVSPLIGWTQEQLLQHGYREKDVRLWDHLRRTSHPDVAAAMQQLTDLLGKADYDPPQALLHWLLVGPWQGRRKLVARLGREANDPIDELLNAASAYAASAPPSLTGFLSWFDAGEGELKREADGAGGLVRVMTVHGAKGLQAPVVILADATGAPPDAKGIKIDLAEPYGDPERTIPLPGLKKEEKCGRIAEEYERVLREEMQEHWRLLYVAMTRAEEALFIGGALRAKDKGEVAKDSWYEKLRELFGTQEWAKDKVWGDRLEWGASPPSIAADPAKAKDQPAPLPGWLNAPAVAEPRPPRPLAPSSLGDDEAPDPPFPPGAGSEPARRGTLIHKLLERLPAVAPRARREAALRWLEFNAQEFDEAAQARLADQALQVIENPDWADLFAPDALAEVPIAALVGDRVVAGTIDRLLISKDRIRLIDFKTSRRPPESVEQVPKAVKRQIAAYVAALEAAYPGREVEAALLYTQTPQLIVIPADQITPHKLELLTEQ